MATTNTSMPTSNMNMNNSMDFHIDSVLVNISTSIKKELSPFIKIIETSNRNMDILKQMLINLPEYIELRQKYDELLAENLDLKAKLNSSTNIHLKINKLTDNESNENTQDINEPYDKTIVSASISDEFKSNEVIDLTSELNTTTNKENEETEYETEEEEEDLTGDHKRNCKEEEEDLTGDHKRKVENGTNCKEYIKYKTLTIFDIINKEFRDERLLMFFIVNYLLFRNNYDIKNIIEI